MNGLEERHRVFDKELCLQYLRLVGIARRDAQSRP
jgi:hypothetical protein